MYRRQRILERERESERKECAVKSFFFLVQVFTVIVWMRENEKKKWYNN